MPIPDTTKGESRKVEGLRVPGEEARPISGPTLPRGLIFLKGPLDWRLLVRWGDHRAGWWGLAIESAPSTACVSYVLLLAQGVGDSLRNSLFS